MTKITAAISSYRTAVKCSKCEERKKKKALESKKEMEDPQIDTSSEMLDVRITSRKKKISMQGPYSGAYMLLCLYTTIRLTTCFGPFSGPSSGHKIYKEEKLYSVSHKIYLYFYDLHCTVSPPYISCDLKMAQQKCRNMSSA